MNIIASTQELLKVFSEVIVASKCGPLARIEKQAVSQKLDLLKSLSMKHPIKQSTIKDKRSNCGIPLNLRKRYSKIRENFVSNPQLNMI